MIATDGARPRTAEVADRLLTTREVSVIVNLSCSTLSRMRKRGDGPRCHWLTPNSPRYRRSDVDLWVELR